MRNWGEEVLERQRYNRVEKINPSDTPSEARTDPAGFLCADLEKLLLILQQETETPEERKVSRGIIAAMEILPRARGLSLQGRGRVLGLNSITGRGFGTAKSILNNRIHSNRRWHPFLGFPGTDPWEEPSTSSAGLGQLHKL